MNKVMSNKKKNFERDEKRASGVLRESDKKSFCHCSRLETRFEDFTMKRNGQELTRNIELQVCLDCDERYIPGRTALDMESEILTRFVE